MYSICILIWIYPDLNDPYHVLGVLSLEVSYSNQHLLKLLVTAILSTEQPLLENHLGEYVARTRLISECVRDVQAVAGQQQAEAGSVGRRGAGQRGPAAC
ncbi:hypothetical protein E2C01_056110 [Portunus trituberculatus]|uniref:Uncharacterized protein n=1 Tax=Portunus trituberculatus TaxID=210409 RepID=A0A5B7GPI6_PORTR|nr:hypothetical protein [Portunus trituberculatus]